MARQKWVSPRKMRWMFNLYPPLFLQRIRCLFVADDYLQVRLVVRYSRWNRNHNGTIFGGTIYAAADPVIPVMYWQGLRARGIELQAWLMSAEIHFRRPGASDLYLDFRLTQEDLDQAARELEECGKSIRKHKVEAIDTSGKVCAEAEVVTHLRLGA